MEILYLHFCNNSETINSTKKKEKTKKNIGYLRYLPWSFLGGVDTSSQHAQFQQGLPDWCLIG